MTVFETKGPKASGIFIPRIEHRRRILKLTGPRPGLEHTYAESIEGAGSNRPLKLSAFQNNINFICSIDSMFTVNVHSLACMN